MNDPLGTVIEARRFEEILLKFIYFAVCESKLS